jgi:hypothetical protein
VVICAGQLVVNVGSGRAIDQHVVGSLHVERLLDFRVGGDDEVGQDKPGY